MAIFQLLSIMLKFTSIHTLLILLATVVVVARCETGGESGPIPNPTEPTQQQQQECTFDDNDGDGAEGYCVHPVWKEGTVREITDYLDCEWESKDVHQDGVWNTFNRVYNEAVGLEKSTIPPAYGSSGFQIPVEIKYSEDVGRGVFTKVPIAKGDLIYVSTNNAQFHTANEYRTFLRSLPVDLACDVIIWAFSRMMSAESDDEFIACVDLDEGSFVNSSPGRLPQCNMELGTENGLMTEGDDERTTWYGCDLKFYANREVAENEEIRADYGDFAEPHGWHEMGL